MKKFLKTLALILWLALIYYFSSQNGTVSGGLSSRILIYIANILKITNVDSFVSNFSFLIRKLAHFSEYFILFILTYVCFKEYKINNLLLLSLLFCLLAASFDEIHQLFIEGRSGQVRDVLIDFFGSLTSSLFYKKILKKWMNT